MMVRVAIETTALRVPPALAVVLGDELLQALARERGGGVAGQRRAEEALGQRVLLQRPPGQQVELALGRDDAARGVVQLARAPATGIYTMVVGTNDSGLDAAGDYLLTLTRTP